MNTNKKQTAVSELLIELDRRLTIINSETNTETRETMISNFFISSHIYLEMEKEQIKDGWEDGWINGELPRPFLEVAKERYIKITYE